MTLKHKGFNPSLGGEFQNGAPTVTELEPCLLDELADWEEQLKPLKQEISEIVGGFDHE